MKRILALLLVLVLAFSLAVPVAAEEPEEPVAKVQFITDTVFDGEHLDFYLDSCGRLASYSNDTILSVFGEPLHQAGENFVEVLTENLFCASKDYKYALFHKSGRQLTAYQYTRLEVVDGYIRGEKGDRDYDFFASDGRMMPRPNLPDGYVVDRYLRDDLIVAGDMIAIDSFGHKYYSWELYTTDGQRLGPEWESYNSIECLTDELLLVTNHVAYGLINEQGESVYPCTVDGKIRAFDNGDFVVRDIFTRTTEGEPYKYRAFARYDCDGNLLWCHETDASFSARLFGRYLTVYDSDTQLISLFDEEGFVEISANATILNGEGYSGFNGASSIGIPFNRSETALFCIGNSDERYTVYDSDCNVVIPAMECREMTIAADHVLVVNTKGNTELYNIKGDKVATLSGEGYEIASSGMLLHKKGNSYAIYNLQGKQVTEYTYSAWRESGAFGLVNVMRNGKYFLVNAEGEEQNKTGFNTPVTFSCHFTGYEIGGNWGIVRYLEPGEGLFWDVKEGDWFCDAVDYCYENNILNGTGVGRFQPEGLTTRAMVVTVLYRLAGSPEVTGELPFTDTAAGQWYSDAVLWASQNDIVNGVGDNRFAPTDNITREQIATILHRYSKFTGLEMAEGADLTTFPDSGNVGGYAKDAMAWAVAEELITGTVSGGVTSLSPKATATRAQLATIISRYQQMFAGDEA